MCGGFFREGKEHKQRDRSEEVARRKLEACYY